MRRRLKYSDTELLNTIRELYRTLGRVPTMVDLDALEGDRPASNTISGRFGSWSRAIEKALGQSVRSGRRPADVGKLERDVKRLAEQYGRPPTVAELAADEEAYSFKAYRSYYGSWSAALEYILDTPPVIDHSPRIE